MSLPTTTVARRSSAMSSAIVLAGASSIRPPRAESTIAFAVSRSPGPQPTSTGPLVSAVRRAARAAKRSADQRLAARPAPGRRTTSRSRGSTPQRAKKASTRASAAESRGNGNSIAAGRTPSGSSSARYCSTTWRAEAGGVTWRFVKSALRRSRQSRAAKPIRSGARVAAVSSPLFRSPCRSRATSKRAARSSRASSLRAPPAVARSRGVSARRQPRVSTGMTASRTPLPVSSAASRRSTTQARRARGSRPRSAAATGSAWTTSPSEESLTSAMFTGSARRSVRSGPAWSDLSRRRRPPPFPPPRARLRPRAPTRRCSRSPWRGRGA